MTYNQNTLPTETSHHILLENRSRLAVSGVEEVESFDENQIVMSTCQGELIVRGEDLHIEQLSLDGGDLKVESSSGGWGSVCCWGRSPGRYMTCCASAGIGGGGERRASCWTCSSGAFRRRAW